MKILVCNAGSSSLKFSFFAAESESVLVEGGIPAASFNDDLELRPAEAVTQ